MASSEFLQQTGPRLLWLREAWEELEPGKHSQVQWARRFGIRPPDLSRCERGLQAVNTDALALLLASTGACADYWMFGVMCDVMNPKVRAILMDRHEGLIDAPAWRHRNETLGSLWRMSLGRRRERASRRT